MTSIDTQTTAAHQYRVQLLDPRWRALRDRVIQRDGYQCRSCRSTQELQVHHRQYHLHHLTGAWKKPWEYEMHLLVTLCGRCHEAGHAQYRVPVISI